MFRFEDGYQEGASYSGTFRTRQTSKIEIFAECCYLFL